MGTVRDGVYYSKHKGDAIDNLLDKTVWQSNPNLLDNWYFVGGGSQQGGGQFPINQRGQTSYTGAGYGIDRWKILYEGNTMRLAADGLYINVLDAGQLLPTSQIALNREYTFSLLTTDNKFGWITFKFTEPFIGIHQSIGNTGVYSNFIYDWVIGFTPFFLQTGGQEIGIVAVKLELGDTQTLAHQENGVWVLNEVPNFQQELAKCQRYQLVIPVGFVRYAGAANYGAGEAFIPTPVQMAKNPIISKFGDNNPDDWGACYKYPDTMRVTSINTTGALRPNGIGVALTSLQDSSYGGVISWGEIGLLLDANL